MERAVLSPRLTNQSPSPTKLASRSPLKSPTRNQPSTRPFPLLPLRRTKVARTKSCDPGFVIYEDPVKPAPREPSLDVGQENVLQPIRKMLRNGLPLMPLLINQFPGYLHAPGVDGKMALVQLKELFQPIHFDNEFGTLHRRSNLPNYTTPPRSKKDQYLVMSKAREEPGLPTPRPRSSSVGRNIRKRPIIRKNPFVVA